MERKITATVGDLIAALSKFPTDAPVFGYSYLDECDVPLEVAEYLEGPFECMEPEEEGDEPYYYPPHGCQGDSFVQDHWNTNGMSPVVYLRERSYCDEEYNAAKINLIGE